MKLCGLALQMLMAIKICLSRSVSNWPVSVFIKPKDFTDSKSYYETRDQFKTNAHLSQISSYNASKKTRVSEF